MLYISLIRMNKIFLSSTISSCNWSLLVWIKFPIKTWKYFTTACILGYWMIVLFIMKKAFNLHLKFFIFLLTLIQIFRFSLALLLLSLFELYKISLKMLNFSIHLISAYLQQARYSKCFIFYKSTFYDLLFTSVHSTLQKICPPFK